MDCIHRNGELTGYSVRYGVEGSRGGDRAVVLVPVEESNGGMYKISGLISSTSYIIEVAGRNGAGTGNYSSSNTVLIAASEGGNTSLTLIGCVSAVAIVLIIAVAVSVTVIVVCVVKRSRHDQYSVKREVMEL